MGDKGVVVWRKMLKCLNIKLTRRNKKTFNISKLFDDRLCRSIKIGTQIQQIFSFVYIKISFFISSSVSTFPLANFGFLFVFCVAISKKKWMNVFEIDIQMHLMQYITSVLLFLLLLLWLLLLLLYKKVMIERQINCYVLHRNCLSYSVEINWINLRNLTAY